MKKLHLPPPLSFRRKIPFYHQKTEAEFKNDKYENYAQIVTRQTCLHLSIQTWNTYPFQPVLEWIFEEIGNQQPKTIVDIGCSVGRLIGELATDFPTAECYGIDFSYQLLKQAHDYWIDGKLIELPKSNRGFAAEKIKGKTLKNLHFALAKGEALPFENNCIDLVISSFTFDRFENPKKALEEMFRVLKNDGKVLIVSPLNFQNKVHWRQFFPLIKLLNKVNEVGFFPEKVEENLIIKEPLDARQNMINWNCLGLHLVKREMSFNTQ